MYLCLNPNSILYKNSYYSTSPNFSKVSSILLNNDRLVNYSCSSACACGCGKDVKDTCEMFAVIKCPGTITFYTNRGISKFQLVNPPLH